MMRKTGRGAGQACRGAIRTKPGGSVGSALAPGPVGLAVATLRQLPGALQAVQLQEGSDELGDGFHVTGPDGHGEEERVTTIEVQPERLPCTSSTPSRPF